MKSSTIRRSTLSKESMQVLENLVDSEEVSMNNNEMYEQNNTNNLPNEYVREQNENSKSSIINKAQEIDMLWQNFKNVQFNSQSPTAYILLGFVIGVVTSVIIGLCAAPFFTGDNTKIDTSSSAVESATTEPEQIKDDLQSEESLTGESTETAGTQTDYSGSPTYKIQDGDTIEKIIIKHYGAYTPERAEAIKKANNLPNLDRISIDQVLIIPKE